MGGWLEQSECGGRGRREGTGRLCGACARGAQVLQDGEVPRVFGCIPRLLLGCGEASGKVAASNSSTFGSGRGLSLGFRAGAVSCGSGIGAGSFCFSSVRILLGHLMSSS